MTNGDAEIENSAASGGVDTSLYPADPAVLIVDDHHANLTALEATLSGLDIRLVTADSGERALELAGTTEFAVILLDVRMPGLSGHATAQQLRQRERSRHTPIILLTAHGLDETDVLMAYARGAVDYLAKPYRLEVLRAKVRAFVDLFRQREHLRQQEAALQQRHRELDRHWFFETLESLSDGFLSFDVEWRFTHLNAVGERVLGRPRAELLGKDLWTEFPEVENTVFGRAYSKAMREQVTVVVEEFYAPFEAWFEARAFPTRSGLSILFRDISERKRHEQERAQLLANERRTRVLVEEQKAIALERYWSPATSRRSCACNAHCATVKHNFARSPTRSRISRGWLTQTAMWFGTTSAGTTTPALARRRPRDGDGRLSITLGSKMTSSTAGKRRCGRANHSS